MGLLPVPSVGTAFGGRMVWVIGDLHFKHK